jgi:hypothetical protein
MKNKEQQCAVTVGMSAKEKEQLVAVARNLDVPYYLLMRRLVRYLLDGKMDWFELFKKSKEFAENSPDGAEKIFIRTQLSPGRYAAFAAIAEEWGSTTSVVLRRLTLLYIAGKIERNAIWY